jgi:hypothetical protein
MAVGVRFIPEQCAGCGSPVEASYSLYRHARRPVVFVPLLILGGAAAIWAVCLSLWETAALISAWTAGMQLHRKERGLLFFVAFAATLPVIAWLFRFWWRFVHGLSRAFTYKCPTCKWSGTVGVVDMPGRARVGEIAKVVERIVSEDLQAPFDPAEAKLAQLQAQIDEQKRQARQAEHASPPNPDFDFKEP